MRKPSSIIASQNGKVAVVVSVCGGAAGDSDQYKGQV